jgi:hypothetical protein
MRPAPLSCVKCGANANHRFVLFFVWDIGKMEKGKRSGLLKKGKICIFYN